MTNLAEAIWESAGRGSIRFQEEKLEFGLGQLIERGKGVATWAEQRQTSCVASVLSNTSQCASFILGTIEAGINLVSLPNPPRGVSLDWYQEFIVASCAQIGVENLVVDASYLQFIRDMPTLDVDSFDAVLATVGTPHHNPEGFVLTQFTSGSTAKPKGVTLDQSKILANIQSTLAVLQPSHGDNAISWLPLSHDMGLIGMFLATSVGFGPDWANGGHLTLMTPERFLRHPGLWLELCSDFRSTITAAPDFGFAQALRKTPVGTLDLSSLRVCITGAEPVKANTLRRFSSGFEPYGFNSDAFCPAYGLAEAALAVTLTAPSTHWKDLILDPDQLAQHRILQSPRGSAIVSAGKCLPGYEIKVKGDEIGELHIRGPSLLDGYTDGRKGVDEDGWFRTADLAFIEGDELYLVGRNDDVLLVAGRNIYAIDVETIVGEMAGVRSGRVTVVPVDGGMVLVAELEQSFEDSLISIREVAAEIRSSVIGRTGISPQRVYLVNRGTLPMTSSGKVQRSAVTGATNNQSLELLPGSDEFK